MLRSFVFRFTIVLALPFLGFSLRARAEFQTEVLQAGLSIPLAIVGRYPQIGNFSVTQLIHDMRTLRTPVVATTNHEVDLANNDGRTSARWTGKKILVAQREFRAARSPSDVTALHEYLRRFGYLDGNYRISLTMWALAEGLRNGASPGELDVMVQKIALYASRRVTTVAGGGGVVGVGGGGESTTIYYRQKRIREAIGNPNSLEEALESNLTVSYYNPKRVYNNGLRGGVWRPTPQSKALCLIQGDVTCPFKSKGLPSESCTCQGQPGVVIFPR